MPHDLIPPALTERFRKGECIFFVGAGLSTLSGLMSGQRFKELLITHINYPRREATLSKVAQAYEDSIDRNGLIELVLENFGKKTNPHESHKIISRLAKQNLCTHIITTNYDYLIEEALEQQSCDYHLTKRDSEVALAYKAVRLIKFHGSANDIETIVISETDYREFFKKRPILRNLLGGLLVEKTFVFLGYSLEDPDFDLIYHDITTALGDFQRLSYAVQNQATDFTTDQWQKFHVEPWTRRKIRIITADAFEFLHQLEDKVKKPLPAVPSKRSKPVFMWQLDYHLTIDNTVFEPSDLSTLDSTVEIKFRIDNDRGNPDNWFGLRLRGVTSHFYAGYLIYVRSSGHLDIASIEEKTILKSEIAVPDPKKDFVKMKVSIVGAKISVWINDELKVEQEDLLVNWPGRIYLHAFGSTVVIEEAKVFEEVSS